MQQQKAHRFSVEDYISLYEKGILSDETKTELLNGEIFDLSPLGANHANAQSRLYDWLRAIHTHDIRTTGSIKYTSVDMFEPDVFVLTGDYTLDKGYFRAADILLAVEIADTSLKKHLNTEPGSKLNKYALGGIPKVWVIDINQFKAHVFSQPVNGEYLQKKTVIEILEYKAQSIKINSLVR